MTSTPTGKVDTVSYSNGSTVRFTYDDLDDMRKMTDALGDTTYVYDANHRLKSLTNPYGVSVAYLPDDAANIKEITYPGDKKVSYGYDVLNRLHTGTNWRGEIATYDYDEAGRLIKLTNFNGTVTTCGYDKANRLTDITSPTGNYHFTLDPDGNRTKVTESNPRQLTLTAGTTSYTYNEKKNRLVSMDGGSFAYDNEGQLASAHAAAYSFDDAHRLTAIGSSTRFSYDGAGNRLQAVRGSETTRYVYDAAGNLLAETDASNNAIRYYIHGLGLLAMITPSGQTYCYHFDGTGNTVAMTDNTRAAVNNYGYDPFGNLVSQNESVAQPFKYVGQYGVMAEANGFYYMRARYYDPQVGRFISEDPIGFEGGDVNLYAYVQNNPVNWVDPEGLNPALILAAPLILDFASGFFIPGPPPTTPAGYWGSVTRTVVVDPFVNLNQLADDAADLTKKIGSSMWEAYHKEHINRNWRNDPTDTYYEPKHNSGQGYRKSDSPCK